jgi:hypothetical protein
VKRIPLILSLLALAAVLVIGLPLFIRLPIWVDVTYHDLSAWNILHGGTHYRDVFETNLPGMVWLHALVRPIVGWSHEAIRIVDLCVVSTVVWMLARFLKHAGVSTARRVWFATAAALFYLFETEFIHCQRDSWMLLPAVSATLLRLGRCRGGRSEARHRGEAVLEGLLWGGAVWIKPHVMVPALFVWLITLRFQPRRTAMVETAWLILGGIIAGGLGTLWLIRTGAWGPMWDVLLNWNGEYYSWTWKSLLHKVNLVCGYFPPFSLAHAAAIPLALWAVFRKDAPRAILAALYLGWLAQATFIQKDFDYAHAPPMLLGLAVIASFRWPVGPVFLSWCAAAGLINEFAHDAAPLLRSQKAYPIATRIVVPHHGIANRERLALWRRCWTDDSWELKDELSFYPNVHCAPNWSDLDRVAEFLRTKDLKDRELICWHDSTHPLYVRLQIKPGIRYPHVITAMKFKSKRDQIRRETFASPARYVVSDLVPISYTTAFGPFPPPGPATELPAEFPAWRDEVYPWNQPVVFRAGRYVVHEVKEPRGEIFFPMPTELWE